jgi:thiamine kinase-like enzyme
MASNITQAKRVITMKALKQLYSDLSETIKATEKKLQQLSKKTKPHCNALFLYYEALSATINTLYTISHNLKKAIIEDEKTYEKRREKDRREGDRRSIT